MFVPRTTENKTSVPGDQMPSCFFFSCRCIVCGASVLYHPSDSTTREAQENPKTGGVPPDQAQRFLRAWERRPVYPTDPRPQKSEEAKECMRTTGVNVVTQPANLHSMTLSGCGPVHCNYSGSRLTVVKLSACMPRGDGAQLEETQRRVARRCDATYV